MATYRYADDDDEAVADSRAGLFTTSAPFEKAGDLFTKARETVSTSSRPYSVAIGAFALIALLILSWGASGRGPSSSDPGMQARLKQSEQVYQRLRGLADQVIAGAGGVDVMQIQPIQTGGVNVQGFVQDLYHDAFLCPSWQERIGHITDGGKWICGWDQVAQQDPLVVYSFGVGDPSSGGSTFEVDMLEMSKAEIWAYDFSVVGFGPSLRSRPDLLGRAHFKPYMIGGVSNTTHDPPIYNLIDIMKENGHDYVDILKIDIEGAEFELWESTLAHFNSRKEPLPFSQLQLEFHIWGRPYPQVHAMMHGLEDAGLRMFHIETNQYSPQTCSEVAYLNIAHPRSPFYIEN